MKVCIFTSYFYPEEFKVNDIAFELVKRNFEVTVITAIPNYPQGKFYHGYSMFKNRSEILNGVRIIRIPVIPRGNGKGIWLFLNYLSFLFTSVFFVFFHCMNIKYNAIFVHENSPFTIGIPAVIMKKTQKIPLYFWVLDLWPETVQSVTGLKNHTLFALLTKMVQWVYNNCSKILISSKGFETSICDKGNYKDKIEYFPNWCEDIQNPIQCGSEIDFLFDLNSESFIVLFAGNIGEAQNIDAVIEAAKLTKQNKNIKWLLIGEGRKRSLIQSLVKRWSLTDTVSLPGRFPLQAMPKFINQCDILLVSLKDDLIFNLTVPAKLQFYMASGKPVIGMLNGEGADLIKIANCGYTVPAGDYTELANTVNVIYNKSSATLSVLGQNGKEYYNDNFSKTSRFLQLERILLSGNK